MGNIVRCSDLNHERVSLLATGKSPIYETGLEELLGAGIDSGNLSFGTDNLWAVELADLVFLCLPTPQGPEGRADVSRVEEVAREIGPHLRSGCIVVNKSTVPVGSARMVQRAVGRRDVAVASNPEFLREGSAIQDFLHPDRIVIGADDEHVAMRVASLYMQLGAPLVVTDPATAETIKYASNAFLATKVSFVNALAALCEAIGADMASVVRGMGFDPRIGGAYLQPGPGWGGSCFPKDTAALVRLGDDAGYDFSLLRGAIAVNEQQHGRVLEKTVRLAGGSVLDARVAIWGLTFKAGTDDLRYSPALELAGRLRELGAKVAVYDPTVSGELDGLEVAPDPYAAATGAVVTVVATEWDEFRWLDFNKVGEIVARRAIVDARNLLDRDALRRAGFAYEGIGVR
jgi:UDPglucose 6-dehydrogenase